MSIYVHVPELWDFFFQNRQTLADNYMLMADSPEELVEVYLTEEHGFPYFTIEINGVCEFKAGTVSREDAEGTYREILDLLTPIAETCNSSDNEDGGDEIFDDNDLSRLDEIDEAANEFLTQLLEYSPEELCMDQDDIDLFVSMVEEYLFETHGFQVRHPTIVEIGDGNDPIVIQYPFRTEE